jgi:cobalamin biosynthesis Mg chelatase CobN
MHRKLFSLFMTLLLVGALAVLAQSPTTSAPGGSEAKDPYGATLDHPNPGSAAGSTGQPYDKSKVNEGQTPATGMTTTETTTTSTPSSTSTPPAASTYNSSTTDNTATTPSTPDTTSDAKSLPRTASDLPLLVIIGLLALGGALTVRSIARRDA